MGMKKRIKEIKHQILCALQHPEAEDGLFLRNFGNVHFEDERPRVDADQTELLEALNELVKEGRVALDESCEEVVFHLADAAKPARVSQM
jgi:hypothetical protein